MANIFLATDFYKGFLQASTLERLKKVFLEDVTLKEEISCWKERYKFWIYNDYEYFLVVNGEKINKNKLPESYVFFNDESILYNIVAWPRPIHADGPTFANEIKAGRNEMPIKNKEIITIRGLIERKRDNILLQQTEVSWPVVYEYWRTIYGRDLKNSPEAVFENINPNKQYKTLMNIDMLCDFCYKPFELNEEFVYLILDGGSYDVELSCHKECINDLI